jgi:hypothetical protein
MTFLIHFFVGLIFLLFSELWGKLVKWPVTEPTIYRLLGAAVLGLFVNDAGGLIVALVATLSGVMNALGWSVVAIYLLFPVGYGYFQFVKPSES